MEQQIIDLLVFHISHDTEYEQLTTTFIASKLKKQRTNVSAILNELVEKRALLKVKTRPVFYLPYQEIHEKFILQDADSTITKEVWNNRVNKTALKKIKGFEKLIGFNESLRNPIDQAKAAVMYPPKGLNILLLGETGTGKSTFSKALYEFALNESILTEENKFVTLNCAEYADNPQLLLSILMGYSKGAFTGSGESSLGLIGEANDGILFLDEVHRLSKEGQEMLFTVIDKGEYRPLGETNKPFKTNVRIVCATTEPIESFLLSTFKRRIPVLIELPSLEEKSLNERLALIFNFFYQEACSIKETLYITKEVLKGLLLYPCKGNIGELENDVRLICAKAFLEFRTGRSNQMMINRKHLLSNVFQGLLEERTFREMDKNLKEKITDIQIHPNNPDFLMFLSTSNQSFYEKIDEKIQYYLNKGIPNDEIFNSLNQDIKSLEKEMVNIRGINRDQLFGIINEEVYRLVNDVLKNEFSETLILALVFHLSALLEKLKKPEYVYIRPKAMDNEISESTNSFLKKIFYRFKEDLKINIPREEIPILESFLKTSKDILEIPKILILCHGKSTASSLSEVVNSLTGQSVCIGYDMPLSMGVKDAQNEVVDLISKCNIKNELLIFADMGSLMNFGKKLSEKFELDVITLELGNILQLLEIARRCISLNKPLRKLLYEIDYESTTFNHPFDRKKFGIIITCMTGSGAAKAIEKYLIKNIEIPKHADLELMTVPKNFDKNQLASKFEKILFVTGTFKIDIPNTRFIPITALNSLNIKESINQLIQSELSIENSLSDTVEIKKIIKRFATEDMQQLIELEFDFFEKKYQNMSKILSSTPTDFSTHIPFLLHLIHLIVRIKNKDIDIKKKKTSLNIIISKEIEDEIQSIESKFSIRISQYEKNMLVKVLLSSD